MKICSRHSSASHLNPDYCKVSFLHSDQHGFVTIPKRPVCPPVKGHTNYSIFTHVAKYNSTIFSTCMVFWIVLLYSCLVTLFSFKGMIHVTRAYLNFTVRNPCLVLKTYHQHCVNTHHQDPKARDKDNTIVGVAPFNILHKDIYYGSTSGLAWPEDTLNYTNSAMQNNHRAGLTLVTVILWTYVYIQY